MASLIEGYKYDIFISYRQKDNKGNRWVSEFVDALKDELESTFKEEISVYFDINPHDGLLETHDVYTSLKDKLKCLVFIPIISRTYCDPKSFAWEHEFKVFVEQASKDQFGLMIKLPNGNMANRVLPIRIHDLDNEDVKQCESILGGVLRGVEFIYREPGVNKPLTIIDDEDKNLNNTKYRIQINKTANALKEIISGMRLEPSKSYPDQSEVLTTIERPNIPERSIIVLPFENMSPDPDQQYFSDGLTEEIITDLSHIHDLLVISRNTAMTFKGTKKKTREIACEVNVKYVLEGSVRKSGNNLRIIAQLIEAFTDTHIWAEKYNGTLDDIFDIQEKVSQSITEALKTKLSFYERKHTPNLKSYDLYLLGRFYWNKRTKEGLQRSIEYFEQAVEADKSYALAYAGLADAYHVCADWNYLAPKNAIKKAQESIKKALSIDKNIAEVYTTMGSISSNFNLNYYEAESYFKTALSLNPNYATAYQWYALLHTVIGQFDKAIACMNQALKLDPLSAIIKLASGLVYYYSKSYDQALIKYKEALNLDPGFPNVRYQMVLCYFQMDAIIEAIEEYQNEQTLETAVTPKSSNLLGVYTKSGKNGLLNFLIDLELNKPETTTRWLTIFYALNGDKQKALDYIEYNVNNLISEYLYLKVEPAFDNLHTEPRFTNLLEKLGLNKIK
jgi:TolB-like protein/Tfp pilus assembly protein PilF